MTPQRPFPGILLTIDGSGKTISEQRVMVAMRALVTGGAGFIGSALCRHLVLDKGAEILNLDKLTYAANPASLADIEGAPTYRLHVADICDSAQVSRLLEEFRPTCIFHLAAESHVDRSIEGPEAFLITNVLGTQRLLTATTQYWRGLAAEEAAAFRFIHVSTDEVYGELGDTGLFTETTPYHPNSPYSASKASSDHFARAWYSTYGLPVLISNCSNNYGPRQFPEKLIPHMIIRAIGGQSLPVYGNGRNVRDWLYVEDHVKALVAVAERGRVGESYNIGGRSERANIDIVRLICNALDNRRPLPSGSYADRIAFVEDRPGHDFRYAIDPSKIERELGWRPSVPFEPALGETVAWYLENEAWWRSILESGWQSDRIGQRA